MMHYSAQLREKVLAKAFKLLYFAKNMCRNIGKNINKNLSGKYSQNLVRHAKQATPDALKTT